MAKPILVANWKNRPGSLSEAKSLLKALARKKALFKKITLFIAPPYTYFESVSLAVKGYAYFASQDLFPVEKGSQTGFISPEILKSFGVKLAILGHSERRALGETSTQVAEKVQVALKSGMAALVCVGELTRDNDGEYFDFLREQIRESLGGVKRTDAAKLVLAYEPVWAIGEKAKGAIDQGNLTETVLYVRKVLMELFGREAAEKIPVLYGGSVDPENAEALMANTGIRGFLVGRSSLSGENFGAIASAII